MLPFCVAVFFNINLNVFTLKDKLRLELFFKQMLYNLKKYQFRSFFLHFCLFVFLYVCLHRYISFFSFCPSVCLSSSIFVFFTISLFPKSLLTLARRSCYSHGPHTLPLELKQAMITLRGMAEKSFSNVYDYQCLTLVLYLCHQFL